MQKNIGRTDRIIRLVVGIALVVVNVENPQGWGLLGLAIGIIAIGTGLVGWCGLYAVFGIHTCPTTAPVTKPQGTPQQPVQM